MRPSIYPHASVDRNPTAKPATAAERVVVALDVDGIPALDALVTATREHVGTYKVGKRLFTAVGPRTVERIAAAGGRVFLDLKYHDIPNTVATAVTAAVDLGVTWITVHTAGGRAMLEAAAKAADGHAAILGVTVLTSLDEEDLASVGVTGSVEEVVRKRARLAIDSGAGGLVCSPREASTLRTDLGPDPLLVTPGIRPAGTDTADQKRAATPSAAVAAGADYLVIGRPITQAEDPAAAARSLIAELNGQEPVGH